MPQVWEQKKLNGNVRISELAILSALAASCEDSTNIFEIGTFDGRTTINLALNSRKKCMIYTLDLPQYCKTKFDIDPGERHTIDKPKPGARYDKYRDLFPFAVGKIHQLLGDSATFDYSPYRDSCSLVFVDGSHTYEYAKTDTHAAMNIVKENGVIIWHDYGIWEGVTRALEEFEEREHFGLRNIGGTSLVYWKKS
jgi:predicted O-methyltransferase YrrM